MVTLLRRALILPAVWFGAATSAFGALPVPDHDADGAVNVLDVAIDRGLPGGAEAPRGITETIGFEPAAQAVVAGTEARMLALLETGVVPLFGYSLDVDVTPMAGATGELIASASLSSFFDERNLITAGGAVRDPIFSVISGSGDGGLFVSTNTDDLSAVAATPGVNDVLAELVFEASPDASGEFQIELGPGTALADANGAAVAWGPAIATVTVQPVSAGGTHYEEGDRDGSNDAFDDRETVIAGDPFCSYISGKLETGPVEGRAPDTYLFLFDKDNNVVCEDDDSSTKGNGKASACFGVEPIASGDGDATVRIGLTGRADGIDSRFNGLFFNAPHGQLGEAEVCVTYYDAHGDAIGSDRYLATFTTGAEAFRINYVVPEGTALLDVEVDNTTETFDVAGDVDFYQIEGLEPSCDYAVTVIGGVRSDCSPTALTLGWFGKNGERITPVASGTALSVIVDVNGRVRLAVSGLGDDDFDGLTLARNIETPGAELPPVHGVAGCYTLKIDWNKHVPDPDGGELPSEGELLQLASGDLNLDGSVNVIDLTLLLNNWGWTAP